MHLMQRKNLSSLRSTISLKSPWRRREKKEGGNFFLAAPVPTPAENEKNIGATISIGREIWCLPYAGFFILIPTG